MDFRQLHYWAAKREHNYKLQVYLETAILKKYDFYLLFSRNPL